MSSEYAGLSVADPTVGDPELFIEWFEEDEEDLLLEPLSASASSQTQEGATDDDANGDERNENSAESDGIDSAEESDQVVRLVVKNAPFRMRVGWCVRRRVQTATFPSTSSTWQRVRLPSEGVSQFHLVANLVYADTRQPVVPVKPGQLVSISRKNRKRASTRPSTRPSSVPSRKHRHQHQRAREETDQQEGDTSDNDDDDDDEDDEDDEESTTSARRKKHRKKKARKHRHREHEHELQRATAASPDHHHRHRHQHQQEQQEQQQQQQQSHPQVPVHCPELGLLLTTRVKALSSTHENSLFRVHVRAVRVTDDPAPYAMKHPHPAAVRGAFSPPLRCISRRPPVSQRSHLHAHSAMLLSALSPPPILALSAAPGTIPASASASATTALPRTEGDQALSYHNASNASTKGATSLRNSSNSAAPLSHSHARTLQHGAAAADGDAKRLSAVDPLLLAHATKHDVLKQRYEALASSVIQLCEVQRQRQKRLDVLLERVEQLQEQAAESAAGAGPVGLGRQLTAQMGGEQLLFGSGAAAPSSSAAPTAQRSFGTGAPTPLPTDYTFGTSATPLSSFSARASAGDTVRSLPPGALGHETSHAHAQHASDSRGAISSASASSSGTRSARKSQPHHHPHHSGGDPHSQAGSSRGHGLDGGDSATGRVMAAVTGALGGSGLEEEDWLFRKPPQRNRFEECFHQFLDTFRALPLAARAAKIRRLVMNSSMLDLEPVEQLLLLLADEVRPFEQYSGGGGNDPVGFATADGEVCGVDCPYKLELEQLDPLFKHQMEV
eukprot:CAMPEP_0177631462 /NCGR_PEP_ID=MMETSP0447-20121125/1763_1 /TAXON_ID=0 /ORGANISM="Stygamoeba regulata, Strain BSH-02190019" /LENGTH=784 /DNA_ID=CAMNT_0019132949 /DNA_START=1044 /DNA_END=3398 /DNA_ORIENTATION=-